MNKKAALGSQIFLVVFILILLIIGGGIVLGTYLFIGDESDFRQAEAEMLNAKIRACISGADFGDNLNPGIDYIYQKCGLNKEVIEQNNLIRVCNRFGNDMSNCISDSRLIRVSSGGDFTVCGLKAANKKFPKCVTKELFSKGESLVIVTVSNQHLRREV
jgi:hypothetical protein